MTTVGRSRLHAWLQSADQVISEAPQPKPGDEVPPDVLLRRAQFLARRLRLVPLNLGLDGVLPDAWVTPTEKGLRFEELSHSAAEKLIRELEALELVAPPRPEPDPNQLRLF